MKKGAIKVMKVICNKSEFQKGMSAVIKAAQTRAQKSILEAILFTAEANTLTMNACDSVTAIETAIFSDVEEEGVCALPAKLLFEIVNKMPDGEIKIETTDHNSANIS